MSNKDQNKVGIVNKALRALAVFFLVVAVYYFAKAYFN